MLRRRGFSPGSVDGGYGAGTASAVKRLQAARGLPVDGRVGRQTLRALRRARTSRTSSGTTDTASGPIRFLRPLNAPMGDGFGFVSGRNHTGIDFPAPAGTPIGAAGVGTVTFAGWNSGGYGNLMIVRHRLGYETWYAHLSSFTVANGASVAGGVQIARVGSTGRSTGPHLHFEVRKDGVPVDPAPYLLSQTSLKTTGEAFAHDLDCAAAPATTRRPSASRDSRDPAHAVLEACR
jgi:murein DD-endopeptidase MepM/ murein hydrolase activator NlpD